MTGMQGNINVTDSVIKSIVGKCALEVPGVSSLSGSVYQSIVHWGAQSETKGIDVQPGEDDLSKRIDLHITVEKGKAIPTVAENLQRSVKEVVGKMTGLDVAEINVFIDDICDRLPPEMEALPVDKSVTEEK